MTEYLNDPLAVVMAYWVFNAAIQSLPKPGDDSSGGYTWFYNFTHTLGGNVGLVRQVIQKRYGVKIK